jgi:hypothetical protein
MNATVRAWCPSFYEPRQSGNGLLARLALAARFDQGCQYGSREPSRHCTRLQLEPDAS